MKGNAGNAYEENTAAYPAAGEETTRALRVVSGSADRSRVPATPARAATAAPTAPACASPRRSPLGIRWDALADALEHAASAANLRDSERFAIVLLAAAARSAPRRAAALGLPAPTNIITALVVQAGYAPAKAKFKNNWPWRQT